MKNLVMNSRACRASVVLLLVAACGGTSQPTPAQGLDAYPTTIANVNALPGDFMFEQEVTMRHPEGENTFRAVLQKRGDTLMMLGLGPHGGRAFLLQQVGDEVSFERFVPMELPFPPEFILYDVHRSWLMETGLTDSGHIEQNGERISDTFAEGRLSRRSYERLDGSPAGEIVVRYEGGLPPGAPYTAEPPNAVLENRWFGYEAHVRTLRWQAL